MNEAGRRSGHDILAQRGPLPLSRAVAALGWGVSRSSCPKETKDDHSSKIIVCGCGVGFCRVRGDLAGAGPDHAGMQREISGRQDRRHAQRPEVERFPQGPMRRRRRGGARCRAAPPRPPRRRRPKPSRAAEAERPRPPRRRRRPRAPRCSPPPWIRNTPRKPPARRACTPASINTTPTRPPTPMAA